jgi:hypothetical protein
LAGAELTIYRKQRISLKYFKPKQHKKGVKVKVLKSAGRKLIPGAFGPDIAKLHGNVFKRKTKKRLPIRKLYGLSPWGAFRKTKSEARVHRLIEGKLRAEMIRVINYNTLKQSGAISDAIIKTGSGFGCQARNHTRDRNQRWNRRRNVQRL